MESLLARLLLVRMRRATRLDDGHAAVALARLHQVVQVDPGVRQRRYVQLRAFAHMPGHLVEQAGAEQGDALRLRHPIPEFLRGMGHRSPIGNTGNLGNSHYRAAGKELFVSCVAEVRAQ